jgi:predicted aconitase
MTPPGLALNEDCQAMLEGARGPATRFAMQLVMRAADVMGATRLVPVTFAHIDACFYAGQAHVDFARFMLEGGATFAVPAWTNNGLVSLADETVRDADTDMARGAKELMLLYKELGCKPVWTCAPYQLPGRPKNGRPHCRRANPMRSASTMRWWARDTKQVWRLPRRCLCRDRVCPFCRAAHR